MSDSPLFLSEEDLKEGLEIIRKVKLIFDEACLPKDKVLSLQASLFIATYYYMHKTNIAEAHRQMEKIMQILSYIEAGGNFHIGYSH